MRVLVVGPGYVGAVVMEQLAEAGHTVRAMRRSPTPLPSDPSPFVVDVARPIELEPEPFDAVVYAVAPSARSPEAYRAAYVDGPAHVLDWLGTQEVRFLLVSSTGVYGHTDGEWVTEATDPAPQSPTGKVILEGERALRARHADAVILRLGGIYGPGRERTIARVRAGDMACPPEGIWGNRIHRDDAAGAIVHLLEHSSPESVYIGVDRDPADLRDVYGWLATQLEVPDPCAPIGGSPAPAGDDAPERRGTNKRCDGSRLVDSGYSFRFSTFREGYGSLLGS